MTWKKELKEVCQDLRRKCGKGSLSQPIEGTPFMVTVGYIGLRSAARGKYLLPAYRFALTSHGEYHVDLNAQDLFVDVASRFMMQALNSEKESQSSKHCDAGYMNDVRFGVEP